MDMLVNGQSGCCESSFMRELNMEQMMFVR